MSLGALSPPLLEPPQLESLLPSSPPRFTRLPRPLLFCLGASSVLSPGSLSLCRRLLLSVLALAPLLASLLPPLRRTPPLVLRLGAAAASSGGPPAPTARPSGTNHQAQRSSLVAGSPRIEVRHNEGPLIDHSRGPGSRTLCRRLRPRRGKRPGQPSRGSSVPGPTSPSSSSSSSISSTLRPPLPPPLRQRPPGPALGFGRGLRSRGRSGRY